MPNSIADNIKIVREQINNAAIKAGRNTNEITLVAVSKRHSEESIRAGVKAGITHLGESRVQEAKGKIEHLGQIARWHMIGHLQTNKAARAIKLFDMIESVDSLKLAKRLDLEASKLGKRIECLIEINSSDEDSKFGLKPEEALDIIAEMAELKNIEFRGIMTIGPYTLEEAPIRRSFGLARNIFVDAGQIFGDRFNVLSMGMSGDYELAIAEGSTMIRVGTAIFGQRPLL